jgi:hypothetical protein
MIAAWVVVLPILPNFNNAEKRPDRVIVLHTLYS